LFFLYIIVILQSKPEFSCCTKIKGKRQSSIGCNLLFPLIICDIRFGNCRIFR
jgi:hypothetical protein